MFIIYKYVLFINEKRKRVELRPQWSLYLVKIYFYFPLWVIKFYGKGTYF
jgi:hypothetical protein